MYAGIYLYFLSTFVYCEMCHLIVVQESFTARTERCFPPQTNIERDGPAADPMISTSQLTPFPAHHS